MGGSLGGGDALSTDPRLTPSGRLVILYCARLGLGIVSDCLNTSGVCIVQLNIYYKMDCA